MDYKKKVDTDPKSDNYQGIIGLFRRFMKGPALVIQIFKRDKDDWVDLKGLAGWGSAVGGADDFFPSDEDEVNDQIKKWRNES